MLKITLRIPFKGRSTILTHEVTLDTGHIETKLHPMIKSEAERLKLPPEGETHWIRVEDVRTIHEFDPFPSMN